MFLGFDRKFVVRPLGGAYTQFSFTLAMLPVIYVSSRATTTRIYNSVYFKDFFGLYT